jgi:DNA-binding SARP family transcriptional activator
MSRSGLASLLWGDSIERKARHSLSQALGRLQNRLGDRTLYLARDSVVRRGELACDAALLEERCESPDGGDRGYVRFYTGDFVAGLVLGPGAADFDVWADARRASYRFKAVRFLDHRAEEAELAGDFGEALQLALRAVEIEPFFQAGHRRVMRVWQALGEHALAIRHYHSLTHLLGTMADLGPDARTRALAEDLVRVNRRDVALRAAIADHSPASGVF